MDMDWRLDRRDGQYKLLDFNPRVGAQFRLFVNRRGVDVVRAMHLDLTGRPVPADAPPDGRTFVAEQFDVLSALGYCRLGELTLADWWSSIRQPEDLEWGWLDADDPLPVASMVVRSLYRTISKAVQRNKFPHANPGRLPRYSSGRGVLRVPRP
jgi:predicted ATP-grasp superfamily ATP-dependent carboligase